MATDTQEEIKKLEARLEELKAAQIAELQERLREARATVHDLERQIEKLSGKLLSQGRRKRMRSEEVRERIHSVLKNAKNGLSQKQISEQSGIGYGTVALFLRTHQKELKTTGSFKSKRYFLK